MPIDVTHRRFRLSDESDQLPYSKAEVPRDLPREMTTILMRLNRAENSS